MKKSDCSGILVYIENYNQKVNEVSLELIGEAYRLSQTSGERIYAVAVGKGMKALEGQLQGYPLEALHLYEAEELFQADIYEEAVEDCIYKLKPSIVLIGGTSEGRALAPRIAVEFRTGLTADCIELQINEDGNLVQIRPAFGGNIMASIVTEHSRPQLATVRPMVFTKVEPEFNRGFKIYYHELHSQKPQIQLIGVEDIIDSNSIANQEVLIVAGRGVKKKEDLEMLRKLANLLGGRLASSRALVEKGWMLPEEQIGLSGTTVSPKCMITFGVSGTVQFIAGMKGTHNIIAVNTDPDAKIFEIAHYPICADLYDVVPELMRITERNE